MLFAFGAEVVGDGNESQVRILEEGILDEGSILGVEVGGPFIENHELRVFQEGTGEANPLFLPGTEAIRAKLFRQPLGEISQIDLR